MSDRVCDVCSSTTAERVIDLGFHPLADSFLSPERLNRPEATYPLRVNLCRGCGYLSLDYRVPPDERYRAIDYSYTAANSPVSVAHFGELADDIREHVTLAETDLAVDIGANDGTLLQAIRQRTGCRVLGIEPAPNIAQLATANGVPTICDYFHRGVADQIADQGGAKVITATNVFNHIDNLPAFMSSLAAALRDDGLFVIEVPYLGDLVGKTAFDTVYLEHISYFGVKPLARLFGNAGLNICGIAFHDYMGGSMRVYASKTRESAGEIPHLVEREEQFGLYDAGTYRDFMDRVRAFKFDLCFKLLEIKRQGGVIVGIGAAAKGNTLLNYCGLDQTILACVTDASDLKIGKFTPGSHLPIVRDADIPPAATHALILPWNIGHHLQAKLSHLGLEFIVPAMGGSPT